MTYCQFFANDIIRPVLNWHGVESIIKVRPYIIKNVCLAGGYNFTPEENSEIKGLFDYCEACYFSLPIIDFLVDEKVRKIFNWRGLESHIGMEKQRIYTTAVSKYPLKPTETIMLNDYFLEFFNLYNKIILPQ